MNLTQENQRRKRELAREYRENLSSRPYAAIYNLNAIGALELSDFKEAAKHLGSRGQATMLHLAYEMGLPVDYADYDYGNEPQHV